VTGLVALAALDTLSRARLGALLGVVALLFAVLTGVWVLTLLWAVARTMAVFLAVHALNNRLHVLMLSDLLLAVLYKG